MTDLSVDAEIEANEQRGRQTDDDQGGNSIVDVVEDAVGAFAKPFANDRPSEKDLEERRKENDADQR